VTGAAGFVGRWLVPLLVEREHEVVAVRLPTEAKHCKGASWVVGDLAEEQTVRNLLRDARPDWIVHLAALSFLPAAEREPIEALRINYGAVDALLAGMSEFCPRARLLYIGTGNAYGARPPEAPPFEEEDPLRPSSIYAATKAAAEQRCVLAFERDGLDVVRVRPLNHTGPGRPSDYVESSIARQLVQIERGDQPPLLRLGNLDAVRDFSDVRDVVAAYELLLEQGQTGSVYNVCSGRGWSIHELLEQLLELSPVRPQVERDPDLYRPAPRERLALVANPSRIRALGWQPRYSLETTLGDLLDDWRSRA
jgi:GDP-4-dehydro-6-deoxy-D-mannose reductase